MPNIKEIVAKEAKDKCTRYRHNEVAGACSFEFRLFDLINFAEALITELANGNAPVARICSGWQLLFIGSEPIAEVVRKHGLKIGDGLYTFPPTAEQIANETAEAIAKLCESLSDPTAECELFKAMNIENERIIKAIRSGAWKEFK